MRFFKLDPKDYRNLRWRKMHLALKLKDVSVNDNLAHHVEKSARTGRSWARPPKPPAAAFGIHPLKDDAKPDAVQAAFGQAKGGLWDAMFSKVRVPPHPGGVDRALALGRSLTSTSIAAWPASAPTLAASNSGYSTRRPPPKALRSLRVPADQPAYQRQPSKLHSGQPMQMVTGGGISPS